MGGVADSSAGSLMQFEVDPSKPASGYAIPKVLVALATPDPGSAIRRRRISLDMSLMMMAGGKDTVLLDQPGQVLLTFTQAATREFPFMFHCHILEHEDGGMMGQYATV